MEMISVTSSNVKAVGHEASTLRVEFLNGSIYEYDDVDDDTFQALVKAESVGSVLHTRVKKAGKSYRRIV